MNDYAQLLKARITHLENKQDQEIGELKKQANAFIDSVQPLPLVKHWAQMLFVSSLNGSLFKDNIESEHEQASPRSLLAQLWEVAATALLAKYGEKVQSIVTVLLKRVFPGQEEDTQVKNEGNV